MYLIMGKVKHTWIRLPFWHYLYYCDICAQILHPFLDLYYCLTGAPKVLNKDRISTLSEILAVITSPHRILF